ASIKNNKLYQHAFDNAAQANIISTVDVGKIINANNTACKLLGYSKKEILTKTRTDLFDINETSFKKMLIKRKAEGQSIAELKVMKKNGKQMPCRITSSIFKNEDGTENTITSIEDLSESVRKQENIDIKKDNIVAKDIIIAQEKSDKRLAENNAWIKYIAKTSYDVMWDWDIASGNIYVGDSINEVFGYKVHNNIANFNDFSNCLMPVEKKSVLNKLKKSLDSTKINWKDSFLFKHHDGSTATTNSRAIIIRDDKRKAIRLIGAIQDVSRLQELELKLEQKILKKEQQGEEFLFATKLSFDVLWDWDLLTNKVFRSDGFNEMLGDKKKNNKGHISDWKEHIHPGDRAIVEKSLQDAINSSVSHWEQTFRFIKHDGSIARVFDRASIIRHANGQAYRMIGAMHDLSKQEELEEKLDKEIRLKEKQIADATEEAKERERANLGKELHDNINQLLAASKMYLDLAKRGGKNSGLYLNRSSEYTLKAIDEIRKLSRGLTTDFIRDFGLGTAIDNLVKDTMEVSSVKISCSLKSFVEPKVNNKFKLNVFRIVQEHINNILKHANANTVSIHLTQNNKSIKLIISDDGVGFDISKIQKGIGVSNIKSRAAAYKGVANFITEPGHGCVLTATIPVEDALLNLKSN
ncbi:MAG TPA: PAS domain-containing protein, partial [Ferruginibacter sp.]|nr:PAS domain-containing protein [Ferruginibacter sp.]